MEKFKRQKSSGKATPDVNIDFGAAAAKVAQSLESGEYHLRIESASVIIKQNKNVLIALDIIETESGCRVPINPLWVDGPHADSGDLAAENQNLMAKLLTLAKLPTAGNVNTFIPQLAGLEFDASLVRTNDNRTGRDLNIIAKIYMDADEDVLA